MPLFGRKKGPLIPIPAFALAADGWVPFTDAVGALWEVIAATAWEGYQSSGRGAVYVNFSTEMIDYIPAGELTQVLLGKNRIDEAREFQNLCSRYKPDCEIVLMTRGARDAKTARAGKNEAYNEVLPTPAGFHDPPAAYELHRSQNWAREWITAYRQHRIRP